MIGLGTIIHNVRRKFSSTVGYLGASPWMRQPEPLSHVLPYLDLVALPDGSWAVLTAEGGLGMAWEIELLGHEFLDQGLVESVATNLAKAADRLGASERGEPRATLQFIFRSCPDPGFRALAHEAEPQNIVQKIYAERAKAFRERAGSKIPEERLYKRHLFLTARVHPSKTIWGEALAADAPWNRVEFLSEKALRQFESQVKDLLVLRESVKKDLLAASLKARVLGRQDLRDFLASSLREPPRPHNEHEPLALQLTTKSLALMPDGVKVGSDTLQVLSLYTQPNETFVGVMARLLRIAPAFELVLNLREAESVDIARKPDEMRNNECSEARILVEDAAEFDDSVKKGNKCLGVSLHVLCSKSESPAAVLQAELEANLGGRWHQEETAAAGIWLTCLPFGFTPHSHKFTYRERRMLPKTLECYLPLFGGFRGTSGRKGGGILVESRSGEPIYIDITDSNTTPHYGFVAGSRSGKSFLHALILMGLLAHKPDTYVTILDKTTTYWVLATVLGEHFPVKFYDLPTDCPNLWLGAMDDQRLNFNTQVIATAVHLLSNGQTSLTPAEVTALKTAIAVSLESLESQATLALGDDGKLTQKKATEKRATNMTAIIAALPEAAQKNSMSQASVERMGELLQPLTRKGLYGTLFDQDALQPQDEPPAPTLCLYDFERCIADTTFTSLVSMICMSETIRQSLRDVNLGRRGVFCVEEAPRLVAASPVVGEAVAMAFETFAKKNISAGIIGADPSKFLDSGPLGAAFKNAANTFILSMEPKTYGPLVGEGKLFTDENLVKNLGSLKMIRGHYAELIFSSPETSGSFRYAPTGFDFWLGISEGDDMAAFKKVYALMKQGGDLAATRALHYLAKHHPWGFKGSFSDIPTDFGKDLFV